MFSLQRISELLPGPLKGLTVRFDSAPINSIDRLSDFVHTRSSYISQTALYGYLKTRMGTRYRQLFEDPVFSQTIRAAAVKIFLAGLGDLTVYAVARVRKGHNLSDEDAARLAMLCFERAAQSGLEDTPADMIPATALSAFGERLEGTDWTAMASGSSAFTSSEAALIAHAPVADEFKELDREIMGNSIRLRWRDAREQLDKRLDADALYRAWLDRG
ncbi:hypothetical protein HH303_19525 [Rhodospirillaceae bacterium KN72]|uniref:Esterase n=1 Tax=Pacificispira spongiicola TaxID=2729598 RepID=A0A7Y0E3R2_9PROT|nr:hypothetical protein [Pacificispira spongiicola]NMM46690.1 hypothetical protein [Pacificispira spongiicola]